MEKLLLFLIVTSFFTSFVSNEQISLRVNVYSESKEVFPGDEVFAEIFIVNKGPEKDDIIIEHSIIDAEENIIDKEIETVLLTTRFTHIRGLELPEKINDGRYFFLVEVIYEGEKIGKASDVFYVGKKPFFNSKNIFIIITTLILIVLSIIVYELRKMKKTIKINEDILMKEKLIRLKRR